MSQDEAPYEGSSEPFVIPLGSMYNASRAQPESVEDPGLNEAGVAAMTGDEATEYLNLLLEVLRPDLPSLAWLRLAAASKSKAIRLSSQTGHALLQKLLIEGKPPISP